MKQLLSLFFLFLFGPILLGQSNNLYDINVELIQEDKLLIINQKMILNNDSNNIIEKVFLEDWSNSYKDNNSKLAKRISDEYSRTFTFANNKQRGFTTINKLESDKIKSWKRLDEDDIIELVLYKPLEISDSIEININYTIKLPDSKFTGFGYDDQNFYLKNWIIVYSNLNSSNWSKQSNLNLDDQSINYSDYYIQFKIHKDYKLFSNLNRLSTKQNEDHNLISLKGNNKRDVDINILKESKFLRLEHNGIISETDIFKLSSITNTQFSYNRITKFISNFFNDDSNKKFLISQSDYELSPFYGLNQLPRFIRPFPDDFLEEIIFLKSFTLNYLNEKILLNRRDSHWIFKGLEIFLIDKYLKEYYPKVKFIGYLSGNTFIKDYEISKINFTDLFLNYSEYFQRLNIHQSDIESSDSLTRINEEIASPYHVGQGLIYLENLIGDEKFKLLTQKILKVTSNEELLEVFNDSDFESEWFIKDYIGTRQSIDLSIQKIDNDLFKVSEKNNTKIPYSIGLIRDDSVVYTEKFKSFNKFNIPKIKYDYVVINPSIKLPELNRNNNYIYKSRVKPLRIRLIGDLDDPKKTNIYLRPEVTYNLYDGISPGINFLNRGFKSKPLTYEIFTQYASKEETLVGSLNFRYKSDNEIKDNFSTIYNLFYTTNHFNENLRYQVFSPSIKFNFRDNNNLRSNIIRSLSMSMFKVNKDSDEVIEGRLNNYSIFNLGYYYSDIGIIRYLKSSATTEFSNNFGKINLVFDYRKLLNNNRQFQARIYLGKFMWNDRKFNNFNYNLGRSGGYLFLDNYLGRSEKTGLLSQQFIMAGGGFKSFFEDPTSNNFMLTSNLNIGLWKWLEGYLDLGILKNKDQESRYFYGTGLRLNLLPDFFELYFPLTSTNGIEVSDNSYHEKIRFIISYNLESIGNLFSRRWL